MNTTTQMKLHDVSERALEAHPASTYSLRKVRECISLHCAQLSSAGEARPYGSAGFLPVLNLQTTTILKYNVSFYVIDLLS